MSDFDYEARIKMEALVADALRLADADNRRKAANKPVDASKQITLSIPLPSLAAMIGAFLVFATINSVLVGLAVAFLVNGG